MERRSLARHLRGNADQCERMDAPLNAALLRGAADDWEAGGPVREVLAGWEEAPGEALVSLRLLGGLHRLVLRGQAPALRPFYRSVGGYASPQAAWPVARAVVTAYAAELRSALDIPPQTNEVGRAAALHVGLVDAVQRSGLRRIRLLELGASAGLNLLVDRFRIEGDGWAAGPADSPVVLGGVQGEPATRDSEPYAVVERRGCDLAPIDPTTEEGRLRLRSFVWPDHVERYGRLTAALDLATGLVADLDLTVDRSAVLPWLRGQLRAAPGPDVLTVVWHSVFLLYLTEEERAAVDAELAAAGRRTPLARVSLEYGPHGLDQGPELAVTDQPSGRRRVLGDAGHHGPPVVLRTPAYPPSRQ